MTTTVRTNNLLALAKRLSTMDDPTLMGFIAGQTDPGKTRLLLYVARTLMHRPVFGPLHPDTNTPTEQEDTTR